MPPRQPESTTNTGGKPEDTSIGSILLEAGGFDPGAPEPVKDGEGEQGSPSANDEESAKETNDSQAGDGLELVGGPIQPTDSTQPEVTKKDPDPAPPAAPVPQEKTAGRRGPKPKDAQPVAPQQPATPDAPKTSNVTDDPVADRLHGVYRLVNAGSWTDPHLGIYAQKGIPYAPKSKEEKRAIEESELFEKV